MADRTLADSSKKRPRGKSFPKGVSGNPGGRPKLPPEIVELRALCRHYTREAVEAIVLVMTNPSTPGSARVTAAALLLDRAWGRATATIEHSVTVPVPAPPDYDKLIAAFKEKYGELEAEPPYKADGPSYSERGHQVAHAAAQGGQRRSAHE